MAFVGAEANRIVFLSEQHPQPGGTAGSLGQRLHPDLD